MSENSGRADTDRRVSSQGRERRLAIPRRGSQSPTLQSARPVSCALSVSVVSDPSHQRPLSSRLFHNPHLGLGCSLLDGLDGQTFVLFVYQTFFSKILQCRSICCISKSAHASTCRFCRFHAEAWTLSWECGRGKYSSGICSSPPDWRGGESEVSALLNRTSLIRYSTV